MGKIWNAVYWALTVLGYAVMLAIGGFVLFVVGAMAFTEPLKFIAHVGVVIGMIGVMAGIGWLYTTSYERRKT